MKLAPRLGRPEAAAEPQQPPAPKPAAPPPADFAPSPPPPEGAPPAASTDDLAKVGAGDEYAFVDFSEEARCAPFPRSRRSDPRRADCARVFSARRCAQMAARLLPEGCPALKAEFEHSRSRRLLVRPAFLRLRDRVLGRQPAKCTALRPPLVLEGPSGAGKSVMLAMLVAAARSAGWLALYVPRGRDLVEGSAFSRFGETDMWDTPDHARQLLLNLNAAHGDLLAKLPRRLPGARHGKLRDLLRVLDEQNPSNTDVTEAGLSLLGELQLIKEVPVLFAVDELNALSGWSEYHAVTGPRSRLKLEAGALRITAVARRLDLPLIRGVRVGVTSTTAGVSPRVHLAGLPEDPKGTLRRSAPRYSDHETHLMLQHYNSFGLTPALYDAGERAVGEASLTLHALCVGSGANLRKYAALADAKVVSG